MAREKFSQDQLLSAAQVLFKTLKPLTPDLRERVLTSVLSLLGMSRPVEPSPVSPEPSARPSAQVSIAARPQSPVELVQDKKPTTNAQRIALFAYYREKVEGNSRFSRADLKPYFAKARLLPPQNFDRDFGAAVQQGLIYEDGDDSYLTSKGLEAVEAGFDGKAQPRGATKATKPRSVKRKSKGK